MQYTDLQYLSVPLPEDLQKLKGYGDFARMQRVIDLKLQNDALPQALKKRLLLEKDIISRMPREYPHTKADALRQLKDCFGDFDEEELEQLRDLDAVEWAYVNGEVKFKNNFLYNLLKTRPKYALRVVDAQRRTALETRSKRLVDTIAHMKQMGGMAMRFTVRSAMTFTPHEENVGQKVTAYLPIPIEYEQVKNVRFTKAPKNVTIAPNDVLQRTAVYQGIPKHKDTFAVEYIYETHMRYVVPDPAHVLDAQPRFYTEELPPHIRFTPYLVALAQEIVGKETNPLVKARKIYDFITTKTIYSFMRAYMTMPMIPEYIATSLKGDCGVQALLFITLCRICGVPARWQSGLYMEPGDVGSHDWAQFYVAPYGWLFADPSFGGSAYRAGDEARRDFYFGNLEPYRMPANQEYQQAFFIPTKFMRCDPYDNQQGEAEYPFGALESDEFDVEHTLISYEEID